MACQTCDHTMQGIADGVWWCPRCGTLLRSAGSESIPDEWEAPKIVPRVRRVLELADNGTIALMTSEKLDVIYRTMRETVGPVPQTETTK